MTHTVIQTGLFPNAQLNCCESMYIRKNSWVYHDIEKNSLIFNWGGEVAFDTFYNLFNVDIWKNKTNIDNLQLSIGGEGVFILNIFHQTLDTHPTCIVEKKITLKKDVPTIIEIENWDALTDGVLFLKLICCHENNGTNQILSSIEWRTSTKPDKEIKLGIVITHFNRQQYVLSAVKRITQQVLETRDNIELIIVDNSQNVDISRVTNTSKVTVLNNRNYGGSGGFMRGILHLQENNFTHCLFMDDDASCESESILRTYALLSYANKDNTAVSGSLLFTTEPFRLFEKGARFDGSFHPIHSGLDMRDPHHLLIADFVKDAIPVYGGWWFFAFTIGAVKHFAFPFFVRGDDIMFGMMNNFDITTVNGICSYGEEFGLKSNPLTVYLDSRSHFVHSVTNLNKGALASCTTFVKFFFSSVFSYNYARAKAVIKAVEDVSKGPEFWMENIDTSAIRQEISSYTPSEKLLPILRQSDSVAADTSTLIPDGVSIHYGSMFEKRWRKWWRILTLNGFLLPSVFLKKDGIIYQNKGFRANFREIFRYKAVLYGYRPKNIGYIAYYDRKQFFKLNIEFFRKLWKLYRKYPKLKKDYQSRLDEMTSREFWQARLK